MSVKSPCNSICELDPVTGLCFGCLRTSSEIERWSSCGETGKLEILKNCRKRREGGISKKEKQDFKPA